MNEPKKLMTAFGRLSIVSDGYFVISPSPDAFIEASECSDGFVLDTGRTTSGKWGRLGFADVSVILRYPGWAVPEQRGRPPSRDYGPVILRPIDRPKRRWWFSSDRRSGLPGPST